MHNLKTFLTLTLTVLFLLTGLIQADIFMKQKMHTDGFQVMGQAQPAKDEINTIWITSDKLRSDNPEQSIIMRLDQNKMYILDNAKKTYTEMHMEMEKAMSGQIDKAMNEKGVDEQQKSNIMSMMQGMSQMKLTITPTDETKKIGNWNCRKYVQKLQTAMGASEGEIWATEDLKVDPELYSQYMTAIMGKGGMFGNAMEEMSKEMKKIKGVPVLTITTTNMMGASVKSTQELLEFKEGTAPSGYFDIPTGYKKIEGMNFQH
jgi:hypothetical protein